METDSLLWRLKDAQFKGHLADTLRRFRDQGTSLRDIAATLSKRGQPVSKSTVANWLEAIDADVTADV